MESLSVIHDISLLNVNNCILNVNKYKIFFLFQAREGVCVFGWFGCCKIYILFNLLASVSSECINSTQICTLNLVILRSDVNSSVLKFLKNWTVFQQESEFFFIQILICFWFRCKDVKVSKCKIENLKSLFCILQILRDFVLTGNHIKT